MTSIKSALIKGALVGASGAVLSVLVLHGLEAAPVMGVYLPKFAIHGLVLTGSSVAATYAVPAIVPWMAAGSGALKTFESLTLQPLLIGTVFLGVESLIAPQAEVQGPGGTFREILVGAAASVGASYTADALGWIPNVLA